MTAHHLAYSFSLVLMVGGSIALAIAVALIEIGTVVWP